MRATDGKLTFESTVKYVSIIVIAPTSFDIYQRNYGYVSNLDILCSVLNLFKVHITLTTFCLKLILQEYSKQSNKNLVLRFILKVVPFRFLWIPYKEESIGFGFEFSVLEQKLTL